METKQLTKTAEQWDLEIRKSDRIPSELMPRDEDASVRCLAKYAKQYYNSLKPKCFNDVFASPACTIGAFCRKTGENEAVSVIILVLNDLIDFFNVSNTMNAVQVKTTAEMILENYKCLKIDDLRFCFNNAKRGFYGQIFRIDGNVIFTWIEQYLKDRINAADEESYSEHLSRKAGERDRETNFIRIVQGKI